MHTSGHLTHVRFRNLVTQLVREKQTFSSADEWKFVEDLLKQKEFNSLVKNINGFFAIFNYKTGYYEYISEGIIGNLGHTPQHLIGEAGASVVYSIMHPEHAQYFVSHIMKDVLGYLSIHASYQNGKDFKFTCSLKLSDKNGEYFWYLLDTLFLQTDENGFPYRSLITCTNIDTFKKDDLVYYNIMKKDKEGVFKMVHENNANEVVEGTKLTEREREILCWIGKGLTNDTIAKKLNISLNTVQTHRKHILKKANCKGTVSLTKYAFSLGLV